MKNSKAAIKQDNLIDSLDQTSIGRFQIQRKIGKGATASVYLAIDPFTNTEVAIKVAHQDTFSDPVTGERFKKMFINESSLAGKLDHPHIVAVFDAGIEKEYNYIVMEYVPGTTLKTYCKPDNLLPINDVMEIAFKCCNGLKYAHKNGLVHRDIKPANLLTKGGRDVMISDFGTALLADSDHTQIMDAVGTPNYMSPEQITGQEITLQADIYSLGVVIYQLLTGSLPFQAKNQMELIEKICTTKPRNLLEARANIPPAIARIVHRCIERNPEDRYASWEELTDDIIQLGSKLKRPKSESSDSEKFNTLKSLSFFRDFSDVELWEVLYISKWQNFPENKRMLQEGKIGGSFFILASGNARIMKGDAFLGVIEAGQCFGEMAYISGHKKMRSASVVSNSDVSVIKIRTKSLQNASDRLQTQFNKSLLKILADRLERTSLLVTTL